MGKKTSLNYKDSGVDVDRGDALVDWLLQAETQTETQKKTQKQSQKLEPLQTVHEKHAWNSRVVDGIGGFASLFNIQFPEIKNPLLVTCTDGVGTKVKLAVEYKRYEEVAQDCVAMCVNDLICTGGMPLLFLDYYATGKLHLPSVKAFLVGLKKACELANCALVGGETAEMPGVYQNADFDCAGFAVGLVDRDKKLGPDRVKESDVLLAIESSGFHSNGYSLIRKVFQKDMDQWIDQLIVPTHIYVKVFHDVLKTCEVHAAAHITGGGFENIPRVLPSHLVPRYKDYPLPKIFKELQKRTKLSDQELKNTLNCGVGFVIVLPNKEVKAAQKIIQQHGFKSFPLGVLEKKSDVT